MAGRFGGCGFHSMRNEATKIAVCIFIFIVEVNGGMTALEVERMWLWPHQKKYSFYGERGP